MGWQQYSTTPKGYGVTGGAANLAAQSRSQLVKCEVGGPQVWSVQLVATTGTAIFEVLAGNGQASQTYSFTVTAGRQFVTVCAEAVEVNAFSIAGANVFASAAPANGPDRAPDLATCTTLALAIGVPQTIGASGRLYALIHNNTAATLSIRVNGVEMYSGAAQSTVRVDYAGAITVQATAAGNVTVGEFFR